MSAVIELVGVSVHRGGQRLLDDVSWQVDEDQRWIVLGGNGAGKTTLLQVAAAALYPTSGMVGVVGGRRPRGGRRGPALDRAGRQRSRQDHPAAGGGSRPVPHQRHGGSARRAA